ncbi:hypothetical protein CERZMDRAFT_87997 [Cercospora zeae-maydis SCOH1-5]|uniref:Hydrophobin n=1 Tax=Cercospora zeae-maydis SCOH1-5 TaxID=717836 RepID=A0A6A6F4G3_9PEZI|nr:hypothetical protein CERZMDRAFT_87997 [Cercospora zeae-maydis SCOH1-5]
MQFITTFAAAAAVLFSPFVLAQLRAPGTSPAADTVAAQDYCQCVGSFKFQDSSPNNPLTEVTCYAFQGLKDTDTGYSLCNGITSDSISGFSNFCASYGDNGARGARCCNKGQKFQDCAVVIPGVNGK